MKEIYFGSDDIDDIDAIDYLYDNGYDDLIIVLMPFYNDTEMIIYIWDAIEDEHKNYILEHHKNRIWINNHYQLFINNVCLK